VTTARRRVGHSRLLGRYPVPTLYLVGTDPPPDPRAPSHWRPGPPPLQHGVDYTFADRHGLAAVRWRPGTVIVVRLASQSGSMSMAEGPEDAVDAVVAELRDLTGLELRSGTPLGRPIDIRRVPDQEIHVACLRAAAAREVRRHAGDPAPSGGAEPTQDGAWYRRGWAIVDTDLAIEATSPPDEALASGPAALSAVGLAVLRHQLGHALGLGHPVSRRALMHQRIPVDLDGYSRGDRHGLALLGGTRPVPHNPPPPPAPERTVPCS
jgi:hypothetical protein